jgi:predicted nucleic acid-binding protein
MSAALLDTSILIADEESASAERPATAAISVVTLGELRAGVLRAPNDRTRASRQARLVAVRARLVPLPVDEAVAEHYGDTLAHARDVGRTVKATDLLIIATARATGRTLHTLDHAQAGLARELGVVVSGV